MADAPDNNQRWTITRSSNTVFSLKAPMHPKNPIKKTMKPMTRINTTGSSHFVPVSSPRLSNVPFSVQAHMPIAIIQPPTTCNTKQQNATKQKWRQSEDKPGQKVFWSTCASYKAIRDMSTAPRRSPIQVLT